MSTSLKRKSSAAIGTTPTAIGAYTAPSVTTGVYVTGLTCANITGASIQVTVDIYDGVTHFNLVKNAPVPNGGSLVVADEGNRQVLNSGDQVFVTSNTLVLFPGGTTGSRTLAQFGRATALKVATTRWIISGTGLT